MANRTHKDAYYYKNPKTRHITWRSVGCDYPQHVIFLCAQTLFWNLMTKNVFFVEIKDAGEGLPKTAASIKEEKMTCEQVSNQLHSTLPTEIMVNIEQRDQPVAPCLIRFVKQMNKSSRNKLPLGGWVGEDAINKRWPNLTGMFDNQYRRSI